MLVLAEIHKGSLAWANKLSKQAVRGKANYEHDRVCVGERERVRERERERGREREREDFCFSTSCPF